MARNKPSKNPSTTTPEPAPSKPAREERPSKQWLRRAHFVARLSRAWDSRFEAMARTGRIGRWYSAVGNEMTTVGAALLLEPNDALSTVHRDLGSVLATYLDVTRLAPALFDASERTAWDERRDDPK